MKTDVIRGFVSILGSKVATLFLGLLTTPILVRLLGSSQYRDYAFLLSILGITMVLINEGFLWNSEVHCRRPRRSQLD